MGEFLIDIINKIHILKSEKEIYLLECLGGLILINVGESNEYINLIEEKLKEIKKSWMDIKLILLTNLLINSLKNLEKIKNTCNPELMLSFEDSDLLEKKYKISSDMELEEGDIIGACGNIEVIEIKINDENNLCYYLQKHKIILIGGAISRNCLDNYVKYDKLIQRDNEINGMINKLMNYDFEFLYVNDGSRFLKQQLLLN